MQVIDKVKNHVKNNKRVYVVGATCTAGGVLIGAILFKKEVGVNNAITQILAYRPTATLEVHIEALGDPGNIIQDVATGTIYASQNQAARDLGVHPSMISKHLKGTMETVDGHILKKLGKAHVTDS